MTYSLIIPRFIERWDAFLLERYPLVWQTQGHYVLYFELLTAAFLFSIGFFYPTKTLLVDPIYPIVLYNETSYLGSVILFLLCSFYWVYLLNQIKPNVVKPLYFLLTFFIYVFCFFSFLFITAPAYRLGTIIRTAYSISNIKNNENEVDRDYFLYAYYTGLQQSGKYFKPDDSLFLNDQGLLLGSYCRAEDEILKHRYSSQKLERHMDVTGIHYLPQITNFSSANNLSKQYHLHVNSHIEYNGITYVRPKFLQSILNTSRSVEHARQYLSEGLPAYYCSVFSFLLLVSLLFSSVLYLSIRNMLIAALTMIACTMLVGILHPESVFFASGYYQNASVYLFLPITGLLMMSFAALRKVHEAYVSLAFHIIVIGIGSVLLCAIFGEEEYVRLIGKPVDLAFFGVQVVGIAGILLMTYLQALPKRL